MTQRIQDTDFFILKSFGETMRPIHKQGLEAMAAAKKQLMANGIDAAGASSMLHAVLKQLGEEARHERLK